MKKDHERATAWLARQAVEAQIAGEMAHYVCLCDKLDSRGISHSRAADLSRRFDASAALLRQLREERAQLTARIGHP